MVHPPSSLKGKDKGIKNKLSQSDLENKSPLCYGQKPKKKQKSRCISHRCEVDSCPPPSLHSCAGYLDPTLQHEIRTVTKCFPWSRLKVLSEKGIIAEPNVFVISVAHTVVAFMPLEGKEKECFGSETQSTSFDQFKMTSKFRKTLAPIAAKS